LLPSTTLLKTPRLLFRLYNSEAKAKRLYPIGIYDYKEIKEGNYFHWDRTRFVKEFYDDPGKSVLILRPRRWAKSTTLSMTKYYFDINQPELAKKLFDGTEIEKDKEFTSRTQGQFPVIYLSFGGCRADNWESMEVQLRGVIRDVYLEHSYLEDGDFLHYAERLEFQKIVKREPTALYQDSLKTLSRLLSRKHGKPVIILIDEYDTPVNLAYIRGYYDTAIDYLTAMFTNAMKENIHIKKGLLTGVLRVAKSGYLSGLNNLKVYSLLDKRYADIYGVQEKELEEALKYEEIAHKMEEVRRYYNGYTTATSSNLYNPWSIINYLSSDEKIPQPYWVRTGSINFIASAIWSSPSRVRNNILSLLDGKSIVLPIQTEIDYKDINSSKEVIWSLLYFSGYLTAEPVNLQSFKARVPNIEVKEDLSRVWGSVIDAHFGVQYTDLISALFTCNEKEFENQLRILARGLFSAHDLARTPDAWYHGFILSLLYPLKDEGFEIDSNREAGLGRPDIVLRSTNEKPNVIIELKTHKLESDEGKEEKKQISDEGKKQISDEGKEEKKQISDEGKEETGKEKKKQFSDDDLRPVAKKGLDQIIKKEYFRTFWNTTNKPIILCSIAFVNKFVAVSMKEYKQKGSQEEI